MTLTRKMLEALRAIKKRGSMKAEDIHPATREALLKRGLVEETVRLYFGPRDLCYRLSEAGKAACEEARPSSY